MLQNDSAFTQNVDSGNSSSTHPDVVAAIAAAVAVIEVAVAVPVAVAAAVAANVATGAFLRFVFDFFPMMITINAVGYSC